MTSTFTFQAKVADEAMTKVGRLFNSSLDDILNELLQNARRSGATTIAIDQIEDAEFGAAIRIADNGVGLANPETLFTLGRSAWGAQVATSEDAAGMGFFALANRGARIIAQKLGTDQSWVLDASPSAFSGETPVVGDEGPADHRGLAITFPERDGENVVAAVKHAARYCSLDITLNGEQIEHTDFLADANHIEEWNGIRIGVFHQPSRRNRFSGHNINFHGVTLWATLPELHQQFHHSFYARIDVTHCAALKLVLPSRKEIVQDEFLDTLRMHIQRLFFRLILAEGRHSLSRKEYCLGHTLNVKLPEAMMMLRPYTPDQADSDQLAYSNPEPITAKAILYDQSQGAVEDQNVAMAISNQPDGIPLYAPVSAYAGYKWYDELACMALKGYRAICGSVTHDIAPDARFTFQARPGQLQVLLECGDGEAIRDISLETDVIVLSEEYGALGEADIHVTATSHLTPDGLVDFIEGALFSPSDDAEAGSYDQQRQWFTDEAEDIAITLLQSSTAADINLIARMLRRELIWRLPKGSDITIRIKGPDIDIVGLDDPAEVSPA